MSPAAPPRWYVISLRPRGEHAPLRRAAARHGAGLIALSPWLLRDRDDATTRTALAAALAAPRVLVTSPAAARAAARLQPLRGCADQRWFAVGAGTAAALRRAGVDAVASPARMDSEGVLALPGLQDFAGDDVLGLIGAPGGRGLLVPALQARGARVRRADVYERVAVAPSPRAVAALRALSRPAALALSSGEALQRIVAALPADALVRLRGAQVLAASERLAALARELGFADIVVAAGPRPRELLAAARAPKEVPAL
ncbi:uroporphyrinogen-III synthase [Lysobacter koreensis]|uniref:Uroporphyrinogen-III synthase n=1 Tax=Lysobacter koreensis TaxID=266122 RepID=A0ABW2YND7_9GAMM